MEYFVSGYIVVTATIYGATQHKIGHGAPSIRGHNNLFRQVFFYLLSL